MKAAAPTPDADSSTPATPLGALSQLVQDALDSGKSLRRLGERAVAKNGEKISWQYFQKLVKNPPASAPSELQIQALAAALGKPEIRIRAAAAKQWLNYEATELAGYDEDERVIVAHLAGMTPTAKRRWRRMIEADDQAQREVDE